MNHPYLGRVHEDFVIHFVSVNRADRGGVCHFVSALIGLSNNWRTAGVGPVLIILGLKAINGRQPIIPVSCLLNESSVLVNCFLSSARSSFQEAEFSFGTLWFLPVFHQFLMFI